jgi:hypothetical protein
MKAENNCASGKHSVTAKLEMEGKAGRCEERFIY